MADMRFAAIPIAILVLSGCAAPRPGPSGNVLERDVVLPRVESQRFLEVNVFMNRSDTVSYDWRITRGAGDVYFDIHRHVETGDDYPVHGRFREQSGTYTQDRNGTVSFLWANDNRNEVTVHLLVNGSFALTSINGP